MHELIYKLIAIDYEVVQKRRTVIVIILKAS
jgi:hypothetical protein